MEGTADMVLVLNTIAVDTGSMVVDKLRSIVVRFKLGMEGKVAITIIKVMLIWVVTEGIKVGMAIIEEVVEADMVHLEVVMAAKADRDSISRMNVVAVVRDSVCN